MNSICVVGSIYEDILPIQTDKIFAGKGFNQAIAAARLGSKVYFVGVGDKENGNELDSLLKNEGVDTVIYQSENALGRRIFTSENCHRYSHFRELGANLDLPFEIINDIDKSFDLYLATADMQKDRVFNFFKKAKDKKRFTVLNGDIHWNGNWNEVYRNTDLIILSREELSFHFKESIKTYDKIKESIDFFIKSGVKYCVVTDGSNGVYLFGKGKNYFEKIESKKVVDTWGISDVFVAALCHRLALIQYIDFDIIQNQISYSIKAAFKAASRKGRFEKFPFMIELFYE
jgi:ribokinase